MVALGGNALLRCGEPLEAENQARAARVAAAQLARVASANRLVVTRGNGPQVGLLALMSDAYKKTAPYPLDVLGSETEGQIGYVLELELELDNALPDQETVAVLTRVVVDARDPAFSAPSKFIGPIYTESEARALADRHGWTVRPDGRDRRRVVPSPEPLRIVQLHAVERLIDAGFLVICTGGGGIPVVEDESGRQQGVEAVIGKDLASALLASDLGVDRLVLATDVEAVYGEYGTPAQRPIAQATPGGLRASHFPAGSMGPKVEAACRFVERTGARAAIGSLDEIEHTRLTPTNAEELLFDDVIWVKRAKEEHDAFCSVMRDRGVEVLEVEVAAYDQGAHVTYLDPSGSQLGHKESIADTARVLGRMYDAIEFRGSAHSDVEELGAHAGVPVYNGLTDEWHPTQMLADFLTMHESSHRPYDAIAYTYMGDARSNVGRSLLVMGAIMGSDVCICGPRELWPPADVQELAASRAESSGARVTVTDDPDEALRGADFIYTDVWVSMGEPMDVWGARVRQLSPYQVNRAALDRTANPRVKFLHCLPAFHDKNTAVGGEIMEHTGMTDGREVTDEVFESAASSIVFDQAENRLHTIKAILVATIGS